MKKAKIIALAAGLASVGFAILIQGNNPGIDERNGNYMPCVYVSMN